MKKFTYNGVTLIPIEARTCNGCYFNHKTYGCGARSINDIKCSSDIRPDSKAVIFIEVLKFRYGK